MIFTYFQVQSIENDNDVIFQQGHVLEGFYLIYSRFLTTHLIDKILQHNQMLLIVSFISISTIAIYQLERLFHFIEICT